MRKIIQFLMKMCVLAAIGYGGYFTYTEYYADERVLIRKTDALLDCFEKDSTESFGSAIDTAELSALLDDEIVFSLSTKDFPFIDFIKAGPDKLQILELQESMKNSKFWTVLEDRRTNIVTIVPANDGTTEGSEKAPARAKIETSFHFRREVAGRQIGVILHDITCEILFRKKGSIWKAYHIEFKNPIKN